VTGLDDFVTAGIARLDPIAETMIFTLAIALHFADNARLGQDITICSCPVQGQGRFQR
jgi:hypothetical protein